MPSPDASRRRSLLAAAAATPALGACASRPDRLPAATAQEQVRAAEVSSASTMARRDLRAFAEHIAEDAVFVNGGRPLRGRAAIVAHGSRHFAGAEAPFAWSPSIVEVAAGGTLGYTEGPVTQGETLLARFYSTWQRQHDGRWRVVFDDGYAVCAPR